MTGLESNTAAYTIIDSVYSTDNNPEPSVHNMPDQSLISSYLTTILITTIFMPKLATSLNVIK